MRGALTVGFLSGLILASCGGGKDLVGSDAGTEVVLTSDAVADDVAFESLPSASDGPSTGAGPFTGDGASPADGPSAEDAPPAEGGQDAEGGVVNKGPLPDLMEDRYVYASDDDSVIVVRVTGDAQAVTDVMNDVPNA